MTSHDIRMKLGLTQVQFADKFEIPLATVRNWDSRSCMPVYINNMLLDLCRCLDAKHYYERKLSAK